jgi:hypothetical protein
MYYNTTNQMTWIIFIIHLWSCKLAPFSTIPTEEETGCLYPQILSGVAEMPMQQHDLIHWYTISYPKHFFITDAIWQTEVSFKHGFADSPRKSFNKILYNPLFGPISDTFSTWSHPHNIFNEYTFYYWPHIYVYVFRGYHILQVFPLKSCAHFKSVPCMLDAQPISFLFRWNLYYCHVLHCSNFLQSFSLNSENFK